jgi:hypothetical protein
MRGLVTFRGIQTHPQHRHRSSGNAIIFSCVGGGTLATFPKLMCLSDPRSHDERLLHGDFAYNNT